ncbi:Capsular polysaccharide synthesis enzyme Cap8C; Manganese-dependent protein-tyrosine phosphatase [hydrothermal vent metagenome]|uniref:Capsular polysaccharide synthesis enzyme Cap8C Manganese-dependent protein-tyrosine phosphatase n=1 Tax=hydrothermal vent metagenome TaxID=652676 RepID=A0A1W1CAX1_9ZZZZ
MYLFPFFNKIPILPNPITVDIHSHLLPGIDDGVKTVKESIEIIKKFKSLGYSKLITTPHIFSDLYPNSIDIIQEKLFMVKNELEKKSIEINLEASAEYFLDMEFLRLIEDDELLPFMGNYILFETPCTSKLIILEVAIESIIRKGYIPVLAHPERYNYLYSDNLERYKELKRMGVLFQVNLKSLQSHSSSIKKTALKLIEKGLVDFIGSDVHRMRDILMVEKVLKSKEYKTILKNNTLFNNN